MSPTKISPREDMVSAAEGYSPYEDMNRAKLRYQPQEELLHDSKMTQGAFGTIRTFSKSQNNSLLSFLDQPTKEPDMNNDLSTRHTDNYYDDNRFKEAIKNRLSLGSHFTVSDNLKFILNCCMWYLSSSLTNNIGKSIMNVFQFPVTLTFVQFGLVAFWCYLVSIVFKATHIRSPTHEIIKTIAPLAIFLIVGHVFSSVAISRVPVSLVHTIKALAPLFTVAFYRFIFHVRYSEKVYISLCPLTLGVILACSFTFSNNFVGLACALGSCLVFVTQNIFSKKLLFKESKLGDRNPNKLDKLNVLFYSSLLSFLLMVPLWLFYDGNSLLTTQKQDSDMATSTLLLYFFVNGTMNFAQNWFAFTTLSLTSPVTYSILSLLKRIFVIVMSIVWFGQQITWTQGIGILLTFLGLYMYQSAKSDVDKGETKIRENGIDLLPMQNTQAEKSFWIPNNDMKSL